MDLHYINEWLMGLSVDYNVNPYVFAAVYVGAIPFFTLSVVWAIRNRKNGKSMMFPILSTGFFFSVSYLYLLVVGENVPVWVYGAVAGLLGFGIYMTWIKIVHRPVPLEGLSRPADRSSRRQRAEAVKGSPGEKISGIRL